MSAAHKYAEVIRAYADGKQVQYRLPSNPLRKPFWVDYTENSDIGFNDLSVEWRIKPLSNKYRIAKMLSSYCNTYYVRVINENDVLKNKFTALDIEASIDFVEWLTDWVELTE